MNTHRARERAAGPSPVSKSCIEKMKKIFLNIRLFHFPITRGCKDLKIPQPFRFFYKTHF